MAYAYPKQREIKKNNEAQAYNTPRAEAWAGPGRSPGPGPKLGVLQACVLFIYVFLSRGFLHFGYAYAQIGLEMNIRLDLISNVCIIRGLLQ